MITDRIIQYVLAGLLLAVSVWGGCQWAAKMNIRHTLDEYKNAQAALVAKAQEDYNVQLRKDVAAADAARLSVKSAVAAVESQYGPTVAAYDALATAARVRLSKLGSDPVPAQAGDASGVEGSTCDGRLAAVYRQYVPVVEAAREVAVKFRDCTAGIARYRSTVDWADAP